MRMGFAPEMAVSRAREVSGAVLVSEGKYHSIGVFIVHVKERICRKRAKCTKSN